MVVTEANFRTGLVTGLFYPVFVDKPPKYKKTESPSSELSTKNQLRKRSSKEGFGEGLENWYAKRPSGMKINGK